MRILKVFPLRDTPRRYNYQVNYGLWDAIDGDCTGLETFDANLDGYDIVFLPRYSRWQRHPDRLRYIKEHKIKKVLFDNDSYYRTFNSSFYQGFDFIFYRCLDMDGCAPRTPSAWLPWSIDTDMYTPRFGGEGILFNCSAGKAYPLRKEIAQIKKRHKYVGDEYIKHLQLSSAAIHTTSRSLSITHAKALEFAACGTQIISNRTEDMNYYFPDELVTYFDSIDHLKEILEDFHPDIKIQKELRRIVEHKHDNHIRAQEVLDKISSIL